MRGDRGADICSGAMHDIEHAIWQTGFADDFAQHVSGHRRELTRFGDGGIADRDGGRDFPAQQIKREIPRRNQPCDAARLTQRIIERDIVGDVRFRFGVKDRGREKAEIAGGPRNVERARERERLASVDRLRACEFLQISLNQIGDAEEKSGAFPHRRA